MLKTETPREMVGEGISGWRWETDWNTMRFDIDTVQGNEKGRWCGREDGLEHEEVLYWCSVREGKQGRWWGGKTK